METNRHKPMDREPAEGARFDENDNGREGPEPEEPGGRASRGTSPKKGTEAGWTPPREESREKDVNPHHHRRSTL
jgi:hypothetical protein